MQSAMRPAISMIELIFAIIVMAVVMMSAPRLMQTASESAIVSIQQEAIHQAATKAGMVLSYPWDENTVNPDNAASYAPKVLTIPGALGALSEVNTPGGLPSGYMAGTPAGSSRTFLRDDGTRIGPSAPLGSEAGDLDDLDDFNGRAAPLVVAGTQGTVNVDYIDVNARIATTVAYISDAAPYTGPTLNFTANFAASLAPTNLKSVVVNVTAGAAAQGVLGTNITLRAFSANIGSIKAFDER
jgi:hypothetical protein